MDLEAAQPHAILADIMDRRLSPSPDAGLFADDNAAAILLNCMLIDATFAMRLNERPIWALDTELVSVLREATKIENWPLVVPIDVELSPMDVEEIRIRGMKREVPMSNRKPWQIFDELLAKRTGPRTLGPRDALAEAALASAKQLDPEFASMLQAMPHWANDVELLGQLIVASRLQGWPPAEG